MSTSTGSYAGVGIECQGFTQTDAEIEKDDEKKSKDMSFNYKPDNDAWVPDCDPRRDLNDKVYGSGTFGSPAGRGGKGSYPGVGIECQGFAQV